MLATALDLFHLDVGRYPTDEEGLKVLYSKPENLPSWSGPYLDKPVPKDPFLAGITSINAPANMGPMTCSPLGPPVNSAGKATTPPSPTGKPSNDGTSVKQG